MPYCSQCGVEVHKNTEDCPLCQAPIQQLPSEDHSERLYPDEAAPSSKRPPLTLRERLRLARGITMIVFLIPILFSTSIDIFLNRQITWASYVVISLGGTLLITLTALFFTGKGGMVNLMTHLILCGVCYGINAVTGLHELWAFTIAQPILIASWIIVVIILQVSKRKQGNLLSASILIGVGVLCLAVDAILEHVLYHRITFGWSLIVISAVIPTALLLLYLYSAKFKKSLFRRFFHF